LVPSPTFTPLPTLDPTTGEVSGSIGWNNQPFAGVLVKLCTKWLYTCSGTEFTSVTAADGKFTITGISPGDYQVITKYPGQNDETRLQNFSGARAGLAFILTVPAGRITFLNPVSICKVDLVLYAPVINGHLVTFSWKAYPETSSYNYWVDGTDVGGWGKPSTTFTATLLPGSYQWRVQSNNSACAQGIGNFTVP
jgi:hypothetical protein